MAVGILGKVASDTLGISDIGKIISPEDFNKVDCDDYIMHEDGEKIYFVIKSKSDEYAFTNRGLIHVDGTSAMSKKRVVRRYEFRTYTVNSVTLETAGTVDLDVEIKFNFGNHTFSIDVDKRQTEQLKDLYKALFEIGATQEKNIQAYKYGMDSLAMAKESFGRVQVEGNPSEIIENITKFNFKWMQGIKESYNNKDFGYLYEKYINN